MEFPLSKLEKQQLKELEKAFSECNPLSFEDEDGYLEFQDILNLLIKRKYIEEIEYPERKRFSCINKIGYKLNVKFDTINNWVADQEKKARKLSNRELKISIVSTIIGATFGLIPTILQLLGIINIA